jgi:PAS domain S-box-containing protein
VLRRLRVLFGSLLETPAYGDPTVVLSTQLVARILDLLSIAVLFFSLVVVIGAEPVPWQVSVTLPIGFALLLSLRLLVRRGRARLAAAILCLVACPLVGMDLPVHGSNTVSLGGFVVVILIGGLTLGPWAAVALAAACSSLLAVSLLGGATSALVAPTPRLRLVHYTTQLGLVAVLVAWWSMQMRRLVRDLRASEARRTLLLEESPDVIVSMDSQGIVTFLNRRWQQMLGYPIREGLGKRFDELPAFALADRAHMRQRFDAMRAGRDVPPLELPLQRSDGETVYAEGRSVPLHDEGQIVGVVSILRDLSPRRQVEAERAVLQEKLVSAQRMEALGRVAGGIAHDFNNTLTIMVAAADAIALRDPAHDRNAVSNIREAAAMGAALTRQLLTFSKREVSEPRPTDVNRRIAALKPMIEGILGKKVVAKVRLAPHVPAVLIDPGQLDQVVVNLAVNARDAMPGGGIFSVTTEPHAAGDSAPPTVEIRLSDSGCGMDSATVAKAFEPFFTTKGERGTGLGLAVVHGIVHQAGGTIRCESEPGRGTTFRLSLPVAEGSAELVPSVVRVATRPPPRRRVLLIDDDPLVRRAVARTLERAGLVVDTLDTAADVTNVETRLQDADALITDVVMPGVTGPDLVDELRRRHWNKPVIFVSGFADRALIERVQNASNSVLITKPFSAEAIVATLDRMSASMADGRDQSRLPRGQPQ